MVRHVGFVFSILASPLDLASSSKAAFETTSGLCEWTVLPFGLTSSPRTLERLMKLILSGLRLETCLVYLDDALCMGKRSQRNWNT